MAGKIRNYYAGGNTARGFHSFFESNLQNLDRLFILKGAPGTGKSSLMKTIGEKYENEGYNLEYIHCSFDNDSIDGVIISDLGVGIVNGTYPHVIEPKVPGAIEEYVNLGSAWDSQELAEHKDQIQQTTSAIHKLFQKAYRSFNEALKIHDEWEKIYITNMDFSKANKITEELIVACFGEMKLNKNSNVRHRYLGAATPKGSVDFIQNLTEDLTKRYFIKGRPGSGKSTMLKKLAANAQEKGFDVEIYHCGFDPNSLDMVVFRELGIAVFDSTSPHEYFPDRENDEIVDIYERAITPKTDEKYAVEIQEISERYKVKILEAREFLVQAKALHDDLEKFYTSSMDFHKVEQIKAGIVLEIDRLAQIAASKQQD